MNTSGCPTAFAQDTFFVLDVPNFHGGPCTFIIPLYAILLSFFTLVLIVVAILRTQYIVRRAYSTRRQPNVFDRRSRFGRLQIITITQSWMAASNTLLILVLPLTFGTENRVMVFLFGLQFLLYNIGAERWLTKIIRLGSRIIGPKDRKILKKHDSNPREEDRQSNGKLSPASPTLSTDIGGSNRTVTFQVDPNGSSSDPNEDAEMGELRRFDPVLIVLMSSVRIMNFLQAVFILILAMVSNPPEAHIWLSVGVGLQGSTVFACLWVAIYQYQRCKNAIVLTEKRVKGLRPNSTENSGIKGVLQKFTRHQMILAGFGAPAITLFLLWATGVFPINYVTLVVSEFFNTVINGSMFVTFMIKTKSSNTSKKKTSPEGKKNLDQQQKTNVDVITVVDPRLISTDVGNGNGELSSAGGIGGSWSSKSKTRG